jgi:hypothetical protein
MVDASRVGYAGNVKAPLLPNAAGHREGKTHAQAKLRSARLMA